MKCSQDGCKNKGQRKHSCPLKEELNNDTETKCNCCEECEIECRYNV